MMLSLFTDNNPEIVVTSLYGFPKPDAEAVARREKAVAKVKRLFADKLRCNIPVERLEKPL
jgi:hypothetical protein